MKKSALICGISGQDGAYLAALLLEKGYRVIGTSRDAQASSFGNLARLGIKEDVHYRSMALNDFRSVLQVLANESPDEVYNFSGQSSVGMSFDQPVETLYSHAIGTLNLLEAIRFLDRGTRLYNAGSGECFGNLQGRLATETDPFYPRSPYAVAKATSYWESVNYRESYGLFVCTGILFNHESPLRSARFVTKKVVAAACRISRGSDEKLTLGDLSIQRDWGWAPEYVDAIWRMLQLDQPDDFVIATGKAHPLEHFVATVFERVGLDWREHTHIDKRLFRPSEIRQNAGDAAKAEKLLGWRARSDLNAVISMMVDAELSDLAHQEAPLHRAPAWPWGIRPD